MVIVAPYNTI